MAISGLGKTLGSEVRPESAFRNVGEDSALKTATLDWYFGASNTANTKACPAAATGTAALTKIKHAFKTLAITATATALLATAIVGKGSASTATGTAALTTKTARFRALPATATGTAALTTRTARFRALPSTATGTALLATAIVGKGSASTATGTAALTTKTARFRALPATATGTAIGTPLFFGRYIGAPLSVTSYDSVAHWLLPTPVNVSGVTNYARRFWIYWGGASSGDTSGGLTFALYQKGATAALTTMIGTQSSRFANPAVGEPTVWTDITSVISVPSFTNTVLMVVNPKENSVPGAVAINGYNDASGLNYGSTLAGETLPATLTGWSASSRRYLAYFEYFVLTQYRLYPNAAFSLTQPHTAVGGASRLLNVKHNPYGETDDATRYNRNLTTADGLPQILLDTYDCDTFTLPSGFRVSSVVVSVRAKYITSGFVSAVVAPILQIGSTTYTNATGNQNLTTSIVEYTGGGVWGGAASADLSPATGLDWTQTEINGLRPGYRTTAQDDGIGTVEIDVFHCSLLITIKRFNTSASTSAVVSAASFTRPTSFRARSITATGTAALTITRPSSHVAAPVTGTGTAALATKRPTSFRTLAVTATGTAALTTARIQQEGFTVTYVMADSTLNAVIEIDGITAIVEPDALTEAN